MYIHKINRQHRSSRKAQRGRGDESRPSGALKDGKTLGPFGECPLEGCYAALQEHKGIKVKCPVSDVREGRWLRLAV